MSSLSLPLRLAGLVLLLSVTSASAADDVGAGSEAVRDSAPAVAAVQPATPAPATTADAGKTNAKAATNATVEKPTATDLGAARTSVSRRVATPTPRAIRRFTAEPVRLSCSGIWCGRQFVLMLGIAY